jgi:hypothetical protein
MDSLFEELVAIDSAKALDFFQASLRETVGIRGLREDEALYVASILAHYSQTSRFDTASIPSMAGLSEVFDSFILQTAALNDSELLEMGGSQASQHSRAPKKRELFDHMAESFPVWTIVCRDLSRALRENRLLLRIN